MNQSFATARVIAMLATLSGTCHRLCAEDWTQFRGAAGQGISAATGLPVEWGPEKNVAWKLAIPGEGWSSPVVQDGRIYLTAAVPADGESEDRSLQLICLDGDDGAVIWSREIFQQDGESSPRIHTKNSHASPTPVIHDG